MTEYVKQNGIFAVDDQHKYPTIFHSVNNDKIKQMTDIVQPRIVRIEHGVDNEGYAP
jgi:hypothetical protein